MRLFRWLKRRFQRKNRYARWYIEQRVRALAPTDKEEKS
jgi:hypothetical protein